MPLRRRPLPTRATTAAAILPIMMMMINASSRRIVVSAFTTIRPFRHGRAFSTLGIRNVQRQQPSPSPVEPPQKQQQPQQKQQPAAPQVLYSNTGSLRRLPVVTRPKELVRQATKAARQVKPDKTMGHVRNRSRKHGAETLNKLQDGLCMPLRQAVQGYQAEWKRLHPFERVVADLSARARQAKDGLTLKLVLEDLHEGRKHVRAVAQDHIRLVKQCQSRAEANEALETGMDAVLQAFDVWARPHVTSLFELQRGLQAAPVVALDTPAVVLVGAPNVGKSSLVRKLSSGTPEVNNYPFTTRGMTLGHVNVFWSDANATVARAYIPKPEQEEEPLETEQDLHHLAAAQIENKAELGSYAFVQKCQVMDSPGLLNRPDEQRNEMEALTLAALQHLPTAVMFVLDLTGQAGDHCSAISDQLQLRRELRTRFPRRPWIDVVSKCDLLPDNDPQIKAYLAELQAIRQANAVDAQRPYIRLSVVDQTGVDELRLEIARVLGEVRVVLDALSTTTGTAARPASTGA